MGAEDAVLIRYQRQGEYMRVTLTNVTNRELREVLVGLWARLDQADRDDHINELLHYAPLLAGQETPDQRRLSGVAASVAYGGRGRGMDITAARAAEFGEAGDGEQRGH